MKVSIIGAGHVGGMTAMRILEEGIADVVLVDIAKNLALAKAGDLDDARALVGHNHRIEGTDDMARSVNSDVVVVTAGLARKPGMTREDLIKKNYTIAKEIAGHLKQYTPQATIIVVSNPVDIITYVMLKETGFSHTQVFGMGVGLDSSRFNNLICEKFKVMPSDVVTLVIGTHGQTMIPLPRFSTVNGKPLLEMASPEEVAELVERTKNRGAELVSYYGSGSAYFAPAAAIVDIVRCIATGTTKTIPVSVCLDGEYGIHDVCIGVPAHINRDGIQQVIPLELNEDEQRALLESAQNMRKNIELLYGARQK